MPSFSESDTGLSANIKINAREIEFLSAVECRVPQYMIVLALRVCQHDGHDRIAAGVLRVPNLAKLNLIRISEHGDHIGDPITIDLNCYFQSR
jgi:hypothetical protein